jgi:membrane protease YdiL (CAAX protease family)
MKKFFLFAVLLEIGYLALSFALAEIYGQWSHHGEIIRTALRIISTVFYGYCYRKYFYQASHSFRIKNRLTPQFAIPLLSFFMFAIFYTNAKNETITWQILFVISGIVAGFKEELFYRGIVQNALQKKYGYKIALPTASLVFTLAHVQYIYYGQAGGLVLIALAGIIFGSIYIYTGSVVFTALVHGLYDALLSVNLVPFRLSDSIALPLCFLIALAFLFTINEKLYGNNANDSNHDTLGLS